MYKQGGNVTKEQHCKALIEAIFAAAQEQAVTFKIFAGEIVIVRGDRHCHLDSWRSFDEQVKLANDFLESHKAPHS